MDTRYVRVLEHDSVDQIRIGFSFPTTDVKKTARDIFAQEDAKLQWCGGALLSARKFYRKIALVDAGTLQPIITIYDGREWDPCLNL